MKSHDRPEEDRFPVWKALSEFFLDTELDDQDYHRIATVLSNSPYSIKQLQDILYYEVYPACRRNLFSPAGEWAGFHPDWMIKNIAPRLNKRPNFSLTPVHQWMFKNHWNQVVLLIEKHRSINRLPTDPE